MMELNDLKSTWNAVQTPTLSTLEIHTMLSENRHPVLRSIRKQMKIEILGWVIFLSCYYSMFDGNLKPLGINLLLIFSILLPVVHSLVGYRFSKHLIQGGTIQQSLENYIGKVKTYAIVSVISRQIYLVGLLFFFTYGLHYTTSKYMVLAILILIIVIQLFLTCRIWARRLNKLKNSVNAFS